MRVQAWLAVTAAFAALNFYAASQPSEREGDIVYSYDVLASALVVYGLLFVVVLALTAGLPRRELLALRAPRSWGARSAWRSEAWSRSSPARRSSSGSRRRATSRT